MGKRLVLKRYLSIRFTGVCTTMESVLKLWSCLKQLYSIQNGEEFPLEGKFHVIKQLVAIFNQEKTFKSWQKL